MSFFIGRHEKNQKGNNRNTHIHFNVMYILFIDDWLLCIFIASVVQWCALCLTHWRPWLNFCGKHNIFNFKHISYLRGKWRELWANLLETGVQVQLMSSVRSLFFLFHANYKVKCNHCDIFNLCLFGPLISSEVNTLNSSGSDPRKNVDRGTTVVFYWSSWKTT